MPTCEATTSKPVRIDKPVLIDKKENLRSHRLYWIGRRTQDIILSALALVVLSPVMLLIAVAIMIDDHSAGPIFYQDRVGRNGKIFRFYNHRWMEVVRRLHKKIACIRHNLCSITPANPNIAGFRHSNCGFVRILIP